MNWEYTGRVWFSSCPKKDYWQCTAQVEPSSAAAQRRTIGSVQKTKTGSRSSDWRSHTRKEKRRNHDLVKGVIPESSSCLQKNVSKLISPYLMMWPFRRNEQLIRIMFNFLLCQAFVLVPNWIVLFICAKTLKVFAAFPALCFTISISFWKCKLKMHLFYLLFYRNFER